MIFLLKSRDIGHEPNGIRKKQKWIQMVCAQLILAGLGLSIFGFYEYEPRLTFWALVHLRRRRKVN